MTDKKYKVIVSDRVKRMLGAHIRFIAQVNKDAASTKKKEIIAAIRSLNHMPQRFPFFEEAYIPPNKYHKMFIENGIRFFIRYRMIRYMWSILLIAEKIITG